jgi:hypothetical protein
MMARFRWASIMNPPKVVSRYPANVGDEWVRAGARIAVMIVARADII